MEGGVERDGSNLYTWKISGEFTNGTNILGLVFFAGKHGGQKKVQFFMSSFLNTQVYKKISNSVSKLEQVFLVYTIYYRVCPIVDFKSYFEMKENVKYQKQRLI